jgi:hypothetical protein
MELVVLKYSVQEINSAFIKLVAGLPVVGLFKSFGAFE